MKKSKNTTIGITFIKTMAERGYRIFDIDQARELSKEFAINDSYINECLSILRRQGWIEAIKPGLYSLSPVLLSGHPVSEYEIAMSLIDQVAIAYWSAMHHHQLTQQIPHKIFLLTITNTRLPRTVIGKDREILINKIHYHLLSVKKEHYFGIKKFWIGSVKISVTDLERTLVDAISKPKYCGGFSEVIEAFKLALDKIDIVKIINYSKMMGVSNMRRLGWMLEYISIKSELIQELQIKFSGYVKLNPSGSNKGKFNKKWGVRINI